MPGRHGRQVKLRNYLRTTQIITITAVTYLNLRAPTSKEGRAEEEGGEEKGDERGREKTGKPGSFLKPL